jgi:hypothetical protein
VFAVKLLWDLAIGARWWAATCQDPKNQRCVPGIVLTNLNL